MRALPLACSLQGAELRERAERWRDVADRGLRSSRKEDGAVVLSFARQEGLEAELRELIELERECCAFLELTLEDRAGLDLRISGPPGSEAVLDSFAELSPRA